MDPTQMTESMVRRELLEQFAKLTRDEPAALDAKFHAYIISPASQRPGDTLRLEVSFGKRSASRPVPGDVLSWSLNRFSAEVAKPIARDLLGSANKVLDNG